MPMIQIIGGASKRTRELEYSQEELDLDLLTWLRLKKVTVASSCDGDGICKKCTIQNDWLACLVTLKEFLERQPDGKIYISYL